MNRFVKIKSSNLVNENIPFPFSICEPHFLMQIYCIFFSEGHYTSWTYSIINTLRYRVSQYVTSLDDVESTLNLTTLTERDGGHYSCVAANKAGTSHHTQHIRIFGKSND